MNKFKIYIKALSTNRYCLFECLAALCTMLNIVYMHLEILQISLHLYRFNLDSLFFVIFDVFTLYFLFLLLFKNKVGLLLIPYTISTIYILINIAYSRYFNTYLPLSLYFEYKNLDGLSSNIIDAFEWTDIFVCIVSTIVFYTYFKIIKNKQLSSRTIPYTIFILIVLSIIAFIPVLKKYNKENLRLKEHFSELNDNRSIFTTLVDDIKATKSNSSKDSFFKFGLFTNLILDIFETPHKIKESDIYLLRQSLYPSSYCLPDSTKYRNIVMIILESMSSFPIDLIIDGKEITPNINKLKSNAYYNPNMISETKLGESSDGQYIYMTGLLPLRNKVTINEMSNIETIPSLPYFIKKEIENLYIQMIIPTNEKSWSQNIMCKKYGIDTLFTQKDYMGDKDEWLTDKQLFELSANIDKGVLSKKDNFMSIILTSSTHSPYNKCIENFEINYPNTYSLELQNYLSNIHYMDKYLGEYISNLKKLGIYEKTMIIIVSDHKPNTPKLNIEDPTLCSKLPLIIINPPTALKNEERIIYQTTLFPTILDLFNIKHKWRGVGNSLFMPDSLFNNPHEIERTKNKQFISDGLLYSEYNLIN